MSETDDYGIAEELRDSGQRLWSSVDCDVKQDGIVVYARLHTYPRLDVDGALAESEKLITSVIERRLDGGKGWVAAIQWTDRLCKTIAPAPTAKASRKPAV